MPSFEIEHRDGSARTGVLHTAHGDVRTPAFVPLATKATVKGLEVPEVSALGYDMVLGNTFHLFPPARARAHPHRRRPARLHALGRADHHRLRRLPGLLDGPRHDRRRDQGPLADRSGPRGRRAGHRGGRRALPLLRRRLGALHGARDLHGDPGRAGLRRRPGLRRVHALPRRPRLHAALHRAHAPLARALPALARRARPGGPARLRDRPGRGLRGPAAGVGRHGGRVGLRRHRHRRLAGPGEGADVRGGGVDHLRAPRGATPPPARHRGDRRPGGGHRARHRHVRLRDAHTPRAPRHGARARARAALARGPRQGLGARRPRAAARGLPAARRARRATPARTCTT